MSAGFPLVTMSGRTMVSRMGESILSMFKDNSPEIHEYTHYIEKCQMLATGGTFINRRYLGRRSSLSEVIESYLSLEVFP
jgi:hypothetical protein